MARLVSFDLVGTLVDHEFDRHLWHTVIPKLYAKQHSMPLEAARQEVFAEYKKFERKKVYTDVDFWFRHLGLHNPLTVLNDMSHMVKPYDDVLPVLRSLKRKYRLIAVTQADRPTLDLKLRASGLEKYFERTFSTVSDFNTFHKSGNVYRQVARSMGLKPSSIVHVGDNWHYDYQFPKKAGLKAYYLNRHGDDVKAKHSVKDLHELKIKLMPKKAKASKS